MRADGAAAVAVGAGSAAVTLAGAATYRLQAATAAACRHAFGAGESTGAASLLRPALNFQDFGRQMATLWTAFAGANFWRLRTVVMWLVVGVRVTSFDVIVDAFATTHVFVVVIVIFVFIIIAFGACKMKDSLEIRMGP